jgi:hypothetical protein
MAAEEGIVNRGEDNALMRSKLSIPALRGLNRDYGDA